MIRTELDGWAFVTLWIVIVITCAVCIYFDNK